MAAAVASDGRGGHGSYSGSSSPADTIMQGLPWLFRCYCRAVAKLRRNLATDAAVATATASGGAGGAGRKGKRAIDDTGGVGTADEDNEGVVSQMSLAAAEFNCMAVLSYVLLQPPPPMADGVVIDTSSERPVKKRKVVVSTEAAAIAPVMALYSADEDPWRCLALAGVLATGRVSV